MVSHWSLKCSQISRTRLGILADVNCSVVWMVSARPRISKSSCPFASPSVNIPRAPITIGITVPFMSHSFFNSRVRPRYLFSFRFLSFLLCWQPGQQSPLFGKFSFSCWLLLGLVVWPRLGDPFVSQTPRGVYASHSPEQILGCGYTIYLYGKFWISCTIPCGSPCSPSRVEF